MSASRTAPLEVVIAGGGVGALEALLALHDLAGRRVRMRVIAPSDEFVHRPLAVAEPFGRAVVRRWPLHGIVADHAAIYVRDTLVGIDAEAHVAQTAGGGPLAYDALLVAIGARAESAVDGAVTFAGPPSVDAFRALLTDAEGGALRRLVFALPARVTWTLPLYELALMTAAHLSAHGVRDIKLSVVSPERAPLAVFGRRTSESVCELLDEAGVELRHGVPVEQVDGALRLADGTAVEADAVVALPRLTAPEIPGLPRSDRGFVPTDLHARVDELDDVYAAGDITWYPVKQGGIAAQQADAAAQVIAAQAGAPVVARPFRPTLRGILLTGGDPRYVRARPDSGAVTVSTAPLWSPHAKVAGRYLGPYLADSLEPILTDVTAAQAEPTEEDAALALALEAADADAGWSDYRSALRWLDVAEGLAVALPESYAEKRRRWHAELHGLPFCETPRGCAS